MRYLIGLCLFGAIGCRSNTDKPIEEPRLEPFDEGEYAPYAGEGSASISGQAFARTAGGDVKLASGLPVILHPVTRFSTETWERSILRGETLTRDGRAAKYDRVCTADAVGGFRFEKLPAGEYYVACEIRWRYVRGYYQGFAIWNTEIVVVGKRFKVGDGEHVQEVLPTMRAQ